ncbi:MAG: DoxX family protein [Chloroflexota bacterium]
MKNILNNKNLLYWMVTGLFSTWMLAAVGGYLFQTEFFQGQFAALGFPPFIPYFLAAAKALGVIAILSRRSLLLKEWAYAGFFLNFTLAIVAHLVAQDGIRIMSTISALTLLIISKYLEKELFSSTMDSHLNTV